MNKEAYLAHKAYKANLTPRFTRERADALVSRWTEIFAPFGCTLKIVGSLSSKSIGNDLDILVEFADHRSEVDQLELFFESIAPQLTELGISETPVEAFGHKDMWFVPCSIGFDDVIEFYFQFYPNEFPDA